MKKVKKTPPKIQNLNTEERILNQSIRLFLEKGYHGTSIDDITQAVGLTKGALYWHFKSKEDLLRRIIEEYERHFLDGMMQTVGEVKGGVHDKFKKYINFISKFAYFNRELCVSFETLAAELIGAHHRIEPEIKRIYRNYHKFLSELIKEGKKKKIFKKELDKDLTALAIMAFHYGILVHWFMNWNEVDGVALTRTIKEIIFYGLMAQVKEEKDELKQVTKIERQRKKVYRD